MAANNRRSLVQGLVGSQGLAGIGIATILAAIVTLAGSGWLVIGGYRERKASEVSG